MNAPNFLYPFIAFFIGAYLSKNVFGGLLLAAVTYIVSVSSRANQDQGKNANILGDQNQFIELLLALSSIIIKADGRVEQKELDLVRYRLSRDFSSQEVIQHMNNLNQLLKKNINVDAIFEVINENYNFAAKIQLMHFLTGVAVSNKMLTENEYNWLVRIAKSISIPASSFQSILAMFEYRRESDQQYSRNGRTGGSNSYNTSSIDKAYKILEVNKDTTDAEIKKAYRKLAMVHHPDKVSHLGPEMISDAYDLIKTTRGFN